MTRGDIVGRVQDRISDSSTATKTIIQEKLNGVLFEIYSEMTNASWYYREDSFNTLAKLNGETLSISANVLLGENYITFSTPVLSKGYIGAGIQFTNSTFFTDTSYYRIVDIGLPGVRPKYNFSDSVIVSDPTSDTDTYEGYVRLDRPIKGASAGATISTDKWNVIQDNYRLRSDAADLAWMIQGETDEPTVGALIHEARDWFPAPFDLSGGSTTGIPEIHSYIGRMTQPWIDRNSSDDPTNDPPNNQATATTINNSKLVTLENINDAHDQDSILYGRDTRGELLHGLGIRFAGGDRVYTVEQIETDVTPTTDPATIEIELTEPFEGTA